FLGKSYTEPIIKNCPNIHHFLNWDHWQSMPNPDLIKYVKDLNIDFFYHIFPNKKIAYIAKKAKIKNRIGTSHRLFHWTTCNHKVFFSRKNSNLHEAQLNFELLKPFYKIKTPSMTDMITWTSLQKIKPSETVNSYISSKKTIIIHAK